MTPALPTAPGVATEAFLPYLVEMQKVIDPPLEELFGGPQRRSTGARLVYIMRGENNGSTYAVRLRSLVSRGSDGRLGEEQAFSDIGPEGQERALPSGGGDFRVRVTMKKGGAPFVMPDLSTARGLVAPVLDLLTFYSDLFLAINVGNLREAGDRVHVPNPTAASWADGTSVLVGEDAVDFEIQLRALDRTAGVATLAVGHVPRHQDRILATGCGRPLEARRTTGCRSRARGMRTSRPSGRRRLTSCCGFD